MPTAITITGDEKVIRSLTAKGDKSRHLKPAFNEAANFAERQITRIPVRTGRLAASTRGGGEQKRDVDDGGFQIGSTTPYVGYVFSGTKHMPPRPPRINVSAIARDATDRINQEIERA